jgi:hypothetical protein
LHNYDGKPRQDAQRCLVRRPRRRRWGMLPHLADLSGEPQAIDPADQTWQR